MKNTRATYPDRTGKGMNPKEVQTPEPKSGQGPDSPAAEKAFTDPWAEMEDAILFLPEPVEKVVDLYLQTITAEDGMPMEDILDETEPDRELSARIMHHIAERFRSVLARQGKDRRRKTATDMMACLYGRQDDETNGGGVYAALAGLPRMTQADPGRELGEKIMAKRNPNYRRERKEQR